MIASLAQTLAQRTPRERWLLALMMGLVVVMGLVVLVAVPLLDQRGAARDALAQAQADQRWYVARQAEIAALPIVAHAAPPTAIGLGGLEGSLIDADLRDSVTLLANAPGDSVALMLSAVPFDAAMHWIEQTEVGAGYSILALRIVTTGAAGLVTIDLRLMPRSQGHAAH